MSQAPPAALPPMQRLRKCAGEQGCTSGDGPICGNGQCQDGETPQSCPADCKTGGGCGDGVCAPGEGPQSCPEDCEDGGFECLEDSCPQELQACFGSPGCANLVGCLQQCQDSDACSQECLEQAGPKALEQLQQLVWCGEAEGCLDPGGGGCGNGICEPGEGPNNCPTDCGDPQPVEQCLAQSCPQVWTQCLQTPGCPALGQCLVECNSDACAEACLQSAPPQAQQAMFPVLQCGAQAGCFGGQGGGCGDGICAGNESPQSCPQDCQTGDATCAGQCGQYHEGAPCQCDPECAQFGDCCDDYAELCTGGGCGDGQCAPGESPQTCPQDCIPQGLQCLLESCKNAGNCLNFNGCANALLCIGQCEGVECAEECVEDAPPQAKQLLANVAACGVEAGCLEGDGPTCGDGVCGDGESSQSCPQDCGAVDPAACIYNACNDLVSLCTESFSCVQGLQCIDGCNGAAGCGFECAADNTSGDLLEEIVICGLEANCLQ